MIDLEAFALELAKVAAEVSLPYFRTDVSEINKAEPGSFDPVTEADRAAERALRAAISARYPEHGIIGEEYGEENPDAEYVWILDPIDGTRAFISGLPLWTNLISLRHQGVPVIGVAGQPYIGEIFIGGPSGAYLVTREGKTPIRTRKCASLSQAVAATTDPDIFRGEDRDSWDRLKAQVRMARYGCDGYAYAMLAAGRIDVVLESELKVWDWSAVLPLVKAAGGDFTGWDGQMPTAQDGRVLAVGDEALRDPVLALLKF
ncbi:histidinol-phosphatase [Brevundimonas sp.]|uniref:histidinol-phosphatase n=1 Tax=Brevundimonas sp. TaxID=1871086 RepID=UPI002FCC3E8A